MGDAETPLLHPTPKAAAVGTARSLGFAISGWLVAAGLAWACLLQNHHIGRPPPAVLGVLPASPQDLTEATGDANGPGCRWLLLSLLRAAGYGQLILVVASGAIPFLLDYHKELAGVKPLLKAMFLVYSGYILTINFLFGLISAFAAESLLEPGFLPSVVTGFMFAYWLARLMVELFVFDLSFLNRPHEIVGRRGIEILFTLLPLIYGLAFAHDMGKLPLHYAVPDISPFGRMLAIIIVLFMVMKICVISMPKSEGPKLSRFQALIFFCLWPGMQPAKFLERKRGLDWWKDAGWGALFVALGVLWSLGVRAGVEAGLSPEAAGLLALPGISMMFHVGALRLVRGALRFAGYDVEQLFADPLLATSMADFWGRRWNAAFSDMNRFVFVAAVRTALTEDLKVGKAAAGQAGILAAFVASALLHECGITLPVLAGFGGPSLYFLIQGFCVVAEKRPSVAEWRERNPVIARVLMWLAIASPFPVCFVVPFRKEIALPLTLFVADLPAYASGLLG
uniref:Wax synthase domain-containing protein n=1 Tax=Alexandrium catenella TaxID=2925 RepID=A0A7S1KVV6_ALECA|mmetsp:Transcript_101654/g.270369  ORF Transcript_101654/g.270369 Transcript_101654/m.270369 type:complete len:510 (+) Transcript_101654:93-1622(+)